MRQRDTEVPESAKETVRGIRRARGRRFSAEEKIRIVLDACAAKIASPRTSIINGLRNPSRPARSSSLRYCPRGVLRRGHAAPD